MLANSGPHLRQFTIHTGVSRWYEIKRLDSSADLPSFDGSFEAASLRFGFTHAEIQRFGSVCPNIQNLGLDIHHIGPTEAVRLVLKRFPSVVLRC